MTLADALLAGPRGRRFLLEFAVDDRLGTAVHHASYDLDPDRDRIAFYTASPGGSHTPPPDKPQVGPAEVAAAMAAAELPEPTFEMLQHCLVRSVDEAMYWQPPSGTDILLQTPEVLRALPRVADHVAASAETGWWTDEFDRHNQWDLTWLTANSYPGAAPPVGRVLAKWRQTTVAREQEQLASPTESSGYWWSDPPFHVPFTTRQLADGTLAGLYFVEDTYGWDTARARRVTVGETARVYEISDSRAWAELCRRFPLDVSAQKRRDWRNTTGFQGGWLMPDYLQVAQHYDALHLSTRGYLETAGRAIPVDGDRACMLSGWAPERTYWLTEVLQPESEVVTWRDHGEHDWRREAGV